MRIVLALLVTALCLGESQAQCRRGRCAVASPSIPFTYPGYSSPSAAEPQDEKETWFAARIKVDVGGGVSYVGSGTPICCENGKTLFLTNAHVVRSEHKDRPISVRVDGKDYDATYVDGSGSYNIGSEIKLDGPDLAIVVVNAELPTVKFAESPPKPGEVVYQRGWGGTRNGPVERIGYVTDHSGDHMTTSITPVQGDSGSAVFDSKGYMVGVTWGGNEVKGVHVTLVTIRNWCLRDKLKKLFPRLAAKVSPPTVTAPAPTPTSPPKTEAPKK